MKTLLLVWPLVLLCLLSGCATNTITSAKPVIRRGVELQRNQLVGKWQGEMPTKEGGIKRWLMHRMANGRFEVAFAVSQPDASVFRQTEVGEWGVSGDYIIEITKGWRAGSRNLPANISDGYFWDLYRVIMFDGNRLIYVNPVTKNRYQVHRVSSDFILKP